MQYVKHITAAFFLSIALAACSGVLDNGPEQPQLEASATTTPAVYRGRAVAVQANALLVDTSLADTGALPSTGGALQTSLLTANIPGVLSAGVLHAATVGQGDRSSSEASVAGLNLSIAGIGIKAAFIASEAVTSCNTSNRSAVTGSSELSGLAINGKAITVTGAPNQTISLLGIGKIVINEQKKLLGGTSSNAGSVTVNALHITTLAGIDVVLASSYAEMICKTVRPSYGDYLTGSGAIKTNCSTSCASFSLSGGYRDGKLWGNLTYIDAAKNLTIRGAGVTSYTVVSSSTRLIKGKATANGKSGFRYEIRAADNGTGTSDTVELKLFDATNKVVYTASGKLACGNLRLHKGSVPCSCK